MPVPPSTPPFFISEVVSYDPGKEIVFKIYPAAPSEQICQRARQNWRAEGDGYVVETSKGNLTFKLNQDWALEPSLVTILEKGLAKAKQQLEDEAVTAEENRNKALDEINQKLGLSKSAVSLNINQLPPGQVVDLEPGETDEFKDDEPLSD